MNSKQVSRRGFRWLIGGNDSYDLGQWALIVGSLNACFVGVDMPIGFRIGGVIFFLTLTMAYIYTASREFGPLERISRVHIFLRFLRMRRQSGKPFGPPPMTWVCWGIVALLLAAYLAAAGWKSPGETVATAIISLAPLVGGALFWHERLNKPENKPPRRNGWA